MQRRLAAILAADVVDYTRLMGDDQTRTLNALRELRGRLFRPAMETRGGRVVKDMGDGWIVEFPAISDAVAAAMAVQTGLAEQDLIRLRIGIHTGEVVFEDRDVFGDGVNIAARLERTASPGQVLISDNAYHSLERTTAALFSGGERAHLKNVARPVAVWRWPATESDTVDPDHGETTSPIPHRPSIAVLPLFNMSKDPEQEYFSDGIAEDIVTALARFNQFDVISRNSSFAYKGPSVDIRNAGRELGANYILEGSVRRADKRVRVTAQLVEVATLNQVWAGRYDRELDDIFAIQDDITERISIVVAPELEAAEMSRARRKNVPDLDAWELTARATWHFFRFTEDDSRAAQSLLQRALALDPGYARAHAVLATAHAIDGFYGWHRMPERSRALAEAAARQAIHLNRHDALALNALGALYLLSRRTGEAVQTFRTAIRENPNDAMSMGQLGTTLIYAHQFEEGVELVEKALRLNPKDLNISYLQISMGLPHFIRGEYEEACEWADKAIVDNPNHPGGYRFKAANLGLLDRRAEAVETYRAFQKLAPNVTISETAIAMPFTGEDELERFTRGLRIAGMPE